MLLNEIRSIIKARQPTLRATVAMATIIPLFLVVFAWLYLTISLSSPGAFSLPLGRVRALYFTITVFSTVGFGDITPKTQVAELVVSVQMMLDLALIGIVVRLIFGAAQRGKARQASEREAADGPEALDAAAGDRPAETEDATPPA